MSRLDNYEMLEELERLAPFVLPIGRTDRVRLIDELVRFISPDVMGHALRSIAICHGLRLDEGDIVVTLDEELDADDYYDDSMDGDFDSAMASAGFGTDEDYGW
jgi:hypothetical protein